MKPKFSDAIISYFLKGGVLLDSNGEHKIKIDIPMGSEEGKPEKKVTIEITFGDVQIRTVKENEHRTEA